MSIRILIDMNLSPDWAPLLQQLGWAAVHWSAIGDPRAADREIMAWALANQHVVFTHDLDFGTALALTRMAFLSMNREPWYGALRAPLQTMMDSHSCCPRSLRRF